MFPLLCVWFYYFFWACLTKTFKAKHFKVLNTDKMECKFTMSILLAIMGSNQKVQNVSATLFSLLQCIFVGGKKCLFNYAEIECWQMWQKSILIYILVVTVPQCLVFLLWPGMLSQSQIKSWQFLLALFIPLPFIFNWMYIIKRIKNNALASIKQVNVNVSVNKILEEVHDSFRYINGKPTFVG